MEETFEQKVMRNIQGQFAVYKTTEVVGAKSNMPNLEWEEQENVDKFFMFAKNLGAKVIYLTEGEETDEKTGESKTTIIQIGFLFQGIMHHINYADEEEDDYEQDDEYVDGDGCEYEDDDEQEDIDENAEEDDYEGASESQGAEQDELVKEVENRHASFVEQQRQ
ncbi:MAG: hypothetical protein ACOCU6_00360 [Nanoarchaeota archaeon]